MRLSAGKRFKRDRQGATSIEYAMIAAGISVAILTGVQLLGGTVMNTFYEGLTKLF